MKKIQQLCRIKKVCIVTVAAVMIICLIYPALAINKNAGTSSAAFLTVGPGARPAGMGGAFTALSDDANAIYWNTGALGFQTKHEIMFQHDERFQGINFEHLAYVHPWNSFLVFGAAITYVDEGTMQRTTINNTSGAGLGSFEADDLAITAAASYKILNELSLGLNLKYIHQKIESYSASGVMADAGLKFITPLKGLTLGLSIRNMGTRIKFINESDRAPITLSGGAAYTNQGFALQDRFNIVIDLNQSESSGFSANAGAEYWFQKMFALRIGYNGISDDAGSGITAGIGFRFQDFGLDYAYTPFGDLGNSHRISGSYYFGTTTYRSTVPRYRYNRTYR